MDTKQRERALMLLTRIEKWEREKSAAQARWLKARSELAGVRAHRAMEDADALMQEAARNLRVMLEPA